MFNPQEQEIIKWGVKNGKTKDQVTQAITNLRSGIGPQKVESKPSLISRVGADINQAGDNISNAISGQGEFAGQGDVARGFGAAAEAANTVLKVGSEVLPESARNAIGWVGEKVGQGFKLVTDEIAKTKLFKELGDLEAQGFLTPQTAPEFYKLKDALSVASSAGQIAGDIAAVEGGVKTVNKVTNVAKNTAVNAKNTITATVEDIKKSIPKAKTVNPLETAIKDATPNFETSTNVQKGKLLTRTKEGGLLKGRTVEPTKLEIEAGTELSKVPDYNPSGTKLSKYQAAQAEVTRQAERLSADLAKEKIIVPKKEVASIVKNSVNKVSEESLLLQKADPAIKNYLRVMNNALAKVDGTLGGILELRKTLDSIYENARGKQAFGSDKIAALDEIHTAARNSLTEYLIKNASTDVKASLRAQWNLYRAMDILKLAAERESGSTIGRLIQNNPLTAKAVKLGAEATGLGAGIKLIQ